MIHIRIYALLSLCSTVPRQSQRALGEELRDAVSLALNVFSDDITVSWFPIDDEAAINPMSLTVDVLLVDLYRISNAASHLAYFSSMLSDVIQQSRHVPSGTRFYIQPIASREVYSVIGEKE